MKLFRDRFVLACSPQCFPPFVIYNFVIHAFWLSSLSKEAWAAQIGRVFIYFLGAPEVRDCFLESGKDLVEGKRGLVSIYVRKSQ
jgi:hypothetical protein